MIRIGKNKECEISYEEVVAQQFLSLVTGAWRRPCYGIDNRDLERFTHDLLERGYIESKDVYDALEDYPIPIVLAYLLSKKIISIDNFKELMKGTDYSTSVMNYEDAYPELLKLGIKISTE